MNRSLRKRHSVMVVLLAILVSAGFAAAIFNRQKPVTANTDSPLSFEASRKTPSVNLMEESGLWGALNIQTKIYSADSNPNSLLVGLKPQIHLKLPDVLVYWHSLQSKNLNRLPNDAFLLGRLTGVHENIRAVSF